MRERRNFSGGARRLLSLTEAAQRTGLSGAQLRYYADTYRDFLGIESGSDARWQLSAAHLRFMTVLAKGGTPAQAAAALRGEGPADEPNFAAVELDEPGPKADLAARVDDMALYIADLAEETKQIQVLLSRIISLLDGSARSQSAAARPWEPPELRSGPWSDAGSPP